MTPCRGSSGCCSALSLALSLLDSVNEALMMRPAPNPYRFAWRQDLSYSRLSHSNWALEKTPDAVRSSVGRQDKAVCHVGPGKRPWGQKPSPNVKQGPGAGLRPAPAKVSPCQVHV